MFELPTSTNWQALTLDGAWTTEVQARSNNTHYQLFISVPNAPKPPRGFPVIYLLDGHDLFTGAAEMLRRASRRPDSTGIEPAVLVGIDHCSGTDNQARRRDYTATPCTTEDIQGPSGGADALASFIINQLVPMIEDQTHIDVNRRALMGHSMAGYFGLRTLVTHPRAFSHVAAISPSIWWNPLVVEPASEGTHVYLAAGEWEGSPAPWQQELAADQNWMARRQRRDMIGHTRDLAQRLSQQWPDHTVQFDLLPGEDHATVFNPAATRAFRFFQA